MSRHSRRRPRRPFDGEKLTSLRFAVFRTQAEIAAEVGITLRQYQRWENGDSVPQMPHVRRLAELFDCEPASFFVADEPNGDDQPMAVAS